MDADLDLATAHRRFAVDLNNLAWTLLERGVADDDGAHALIDAAHASAHHWSIAGGALHALRAATLVTTVYAHLEWSATALRHADRTERLLRAAADDATPFDRAVALAAISRGYELGGRGEDAARTWLEAREHAAGADADERTVLAQLYGLDPG